MHRTEVIQKLIDVNHFEKYLEIGVHMGFSFLPIKCKTKVGVDPKFKIKSRDKIKWLFKNPLNLNNKYLEITSEEFFKNRIELLKGDLIFDLVFVDGLHTFEGSLEDVLNSLKCINKGGIIVVHDCFPPSKIAATPAKSYQELHELKPEGWNGLWCGDVWKTIVYLKKEFPNSLEISVLNTDFGLGIIRFKGENNFPLEINSSLVEEIKLLTYDDLIKNPEEIIGLKDIKYLELINPDTVLI